MLHHARAVVSPNFNLHLPTNFNLHLPMFICIWKQEAAVALANAGADVVAFDMDSEPEDMAKALKGAYGLFVITNFWEHFDYHRESAQAKAVVEAGIIAGVEHFVWSTLEDTTPFFDSSEHSPPKVNGAYVPHFDAKGQANAFFPADKSTILYTSFYLENLYQFGLVKDGVFHSNLGDNNPLPVIAVDDIGMSTYGIFKAGDMYKGKKVYLAGERVTPVELMRIASEVTGQIFSHKSIDRQVYANLGFPGSDDLANMFEYMRLNPKYSESNDPAQAKLLNRNTQSVRSFFETHKKEILSVGPK